MDHTPNRGMQTLMHSQQRYQRNEDVLRGLENGTIHLMTLDPPGQIHKDQEFIDHTLLSPQYVETNHVVETDAANFLGDGNDSDGQIKSVRHFLHKNQLGVETQVIVSNSKEQISPLTETYQMDYAYKTHIPQLTPIRKLRSSRAEELRLSNPRSDEDDCLEIIDGNFVGGETKAKRNLPHKKRITKKLNKRNTMEDQQMEQMQSSPILAMAPQQSNSATAFACQLCGHISKDQLEFFTHLKSHYEPARTVVESSSPVLMAKDEEGSIKPDQMSISELHLMDCEDDEDEEIDVGLPDIEEDDEDEIEDSSLKIISENTEFSDTEDMLEGMRGVVDKVQQSVENDLNEESKHNWYSEELQDDILLMKPTEDESQDGEVKEEMEMLQMYNDSDLNAKPQSEPNESESLHEPFENKLEEQEKDVPASMPLPEIDSSDKHENMSRILGRRNKISQVESQFLRDNVMIYEEILDDDTRDVDHKSKRKILTKTRYICKVCDKVCNSRNALQYHSRSHTGERPHMCDICGKGFLSRSALNVHVRVHSGDKPFECRNCLRPFRQWGDLQYHMTSIHSDEKNHQCEFCGKKFSRRYSLVVHRRIHTGERNYVCEFCKKTFRASSYLQEHRKIHTGEKPHPCTFCDRKFRVRGDLKRHIKIHTRDKPLPMRKSSPRRKKQEILNREDLEPEPTFSECSNGATTNENVDCIQFANGIDIQEDTLDIKDEVIYAEHYSEEIVAEVQHQQQDGELQNVIEKPANTQSPVIKIEVDPSISLRRIDPKVMSADGQQVLDMSKLLELPRSDLGHNEHILVWSYPE